MNFLFCVVFFVNFVWTAVILASLILSVFSGVPEKVLESGILGAADGVSILVSLAGIICFWSGILRIAEKGGAAERCQKLVSPLISRLFPETRQKDKIMLNIIANLFGAGNAATPAGIAAMEGMDAENGNSPRPSREMERFAVMNTASLQLFPTTVISILSSLGAKDPLSIVPYIWLSSAAALFSALFALKLISRGR